MVPACFLNVMILIYPSALKIYLCLKEKADNPLPNKEERFLISCL